ncbi:hypothetical protein [Streptomyces sp. NPDC005486]|uniref:hypothetical protein n=1 Tax=Streptomyces sp. NPDC005486 TaxID=3155345 RepID=UPI0033A28B38
MTGIGVEMGAQAARARALAVLRIRSRALAVALLPAAAAVILLAGGSTGHFVGPGWDAARWAVSVVALVVLLAAGVIALVVARARPAVSPTVAVAEEAAPDLYRLVRDLADRLDVPAPSAIALTPDCDSWLEDRTHRAHGPSPSRGGDEIVGPGGSHGRLHRRPTAAPVLVIGSPFLWWMRVGELRAVLAPVVAGTGPSAHPDIAAARRFVRGLDAAVAVCAYRGDRYPVLRPACSGIGWVARVMLRGCQTHAGEMERGVAAAAAERAQTVDYGLRIVAQEQVGLAYAGWDRLLTRVALPAWRMGRWPSRLDAGVVAALTELSRRDRLAEGFASRLGERPACDLLEEPGTIDEAASLLAARLFHGGPADPGPDWSPVAWEDYPDEVVDRKWRTDAARLHRVLDTLGVRPTPGLTAMSHPGGSSGPTLARVLDHLTDRPDDVDGPHPAHSAPTCDSAKDASTAPTRDSAKDASTAPTRDSAKDASTSTPFAPESGPTPSLPPTGPPATTNPPTHPGATPVSGTTPVSGATEDPGAMAVPGTASDPGATADPGTAPVPGATEDPDAMAVPGATTDPGATADPGTASDPGATADPGTAPVPGTPADPGTAPVPGTPADPGTAPVADTTTVQGATADPGTAPVQGATTDPGAIPAPGATADPGTTAVSGTTAVPGTTADPGATADPSTAADLRTAPAPAPEPAPLSEDDEDPVPPNPRSVALAAGLGAELGREEAAAAAAAPPVPAGPAPGQGPDTALWDEGVPLFPLEPPRTDRELLADHVTAMVCCAAMDTVGAIPGLDWLDGPTLLVDGERVADLTLRVLSLVEDGDALPLRTWLVERGIRPEKPVRLC